MNLLNSDHSTKHYSILYIKKKILLYFKAQHLNSLFVHKHIFIQPDIGYTWKKIKT